MLRVAEPLRRDGWIFRPSATGRRCARDRLCAVLSSLGLNAVPQGFRSSFQDWAAESTDTPGDRGAK